MARPLYFLVLHEKQHEQKTPHPQERTHGGKLKIRKTDDHQHNQPVNNAE
jgi:hypothetical protein